MALKSLKGEKYRDVREELVTNFSEYLSEIHLEYYAEHTAKSVKKATYQYLRSGKGLAYTKDSDYRH